MGFLDFLFGSKSASNVEVVSDRIWLSQEAKWSGIRKEVAERSASETAAILLVAHFPDTLGQLDAIAGETQSKVPVTATLAETLSSDIAARLNLDGTATIDLIVGERHPLLDVDEKLLQFARELPCRCRLIHHVSLDDPVLKPLAGEWVRTALKNLGMKKDEPIESNMVSRRIKAAQKKIQSEAIGDSQAGSAAEWMEKNLPSQG